MQICVPYETKLIKIADEVSQPISRQPLSMELTKISVLHVRYFSYCQLIVQYKGCEWLFVLHSTEYIENIKF